MSPDIFIEDFERTENSDYLHGVIGRSLIVATRFDAMCTALSKAIEIKTGAVYLLASDEDFDQFVTQAETKYRTLNSSINSFELPDQISDILHQARKARNEVAHSLTKGLEGCIDTKISNDSLIDEVSGLLAKIVDGDIISSVLISNFNDEPILNNVSLEGYKDKIINWVVEP
jgi:hypothetical protein